MTGVPGPAESLVCLPVLGIGEVPAGADLAAEIADRMPLEDGDVLVVTSKVVSKAEGRVVTGDRRTAVTTETDRQVAVRGETAIVRTRHGLVLAAAGVDASNTRAGTAVLLPLDPDRSAVALRTGIRERTGRNVAVLVTDTAGRPWRIGQTDLAIGAAGLEVLHDYAGRRDGHGNELAVTAPAVADEVAAAADLVKGKLAGRPVAVVRGLAALVLPPGRHGPGARALVREEDQDMFGFGARDAVLRALRPDDSDRRGFGAPAGPAEVAARLAAVVPDAPVSVAGATVTVSLDGLPERRAGAVETAVAAAGFALGWWCEPAGDRIRLRPRPAAP